MKPGTSLDAFAVWLGLASPALASLLVPAVESASSQRFAAARDGIEFSHQLRQGLKARLLVDAAQKLAILKYDQFHVQSFDNSIHKSRCAEEFSVMKSILSTRNAMLRTCEKLIFNPALLL